VNPKFGALLLHAVQFTCVRKAVVGRARLPASEPFSLWCIDVGLAGTILADDQARERLLSLVVGDGTEAERTRPEWLAVRRRALESTTLPTAIGRAATRSSELRNWLINLTRHSDSELLHWAVPALGQCLEHHDALKTLLSYISPEFPREHEAVQRDAAVQLSGQIASCDVRRQAVALLKHAKSGRLEVAVPLVLAGLGYPEVQQALRDTLLGRMAADGRDRWLGPAGDATSAEPDRVALEELCAGLGGALHETSIQQTVLTAAADGWKLALKLLLAELSSHGRAQRLIPGFIEALFGLPLTIRDELAGVVVWLPDPPALTLKFLQSTACDLACERQNREWFRVVAERTGVVFSRLQGKTARVPQGDQRAIAAPAPTRSRDREASSGSTTGTKPVHSSGDCHT
jgi:hypothetical protein